MVKVYNLYDDELMYEFDNRDEAEKWIGKCAFEWNDGRYRFWSQDGKDCYDVGPRVFYIKEE